MKSLFLALLLATNPAADVQAPHAVLELSPYLHGIPSIKARVGSHQGTFIFDTAGGLSTLNSSFARSVGCSPWGRLTGHRMRGDRVDVSRCDGISFAFESAFTEPLTVGVWDFSFLLPPDAPSLSGILALDAFSKHAITIDLSAGKVIVESSETLPRRIASSVEIPMKLAREMSGFSLVPMVAVQAEKGVLWFELDSGSDAPLIVSPHAMSLLSAGQEEQQSLGFKLGPFQVPAEVKQEELIIDGNIGAPIMRKFVFTLDIPNQRMWVSKK